MSPGIIMESHANANTSKKKQCNLLKEEKTDHAGSSLSRYLRFIVDICPCYMTDTTDMIDLY